MAEAKENGQTAPMRLPGLGFKRPGGFKPPAFAGAPMAQPNKKPAVGAAPRAPAAQPAAASPSTLYFTVLYCKNQPSKKLRKNKQFLDGVLEIKGGAAAALYDAEGKPISRATLRGYDAASLGNGSSVVVGGWELEVEAPLPPDQFLRGEAFLKPCNAAAAAPAASPPRGGSPPRPPPGVEAAFKRPVMAAGAAFKRPGGPAGPAAPAKPAAWLHDPAAEGAVVLNAGQWAGGAGRDAQGRPISPVVLDPYIARQLRPHQVEGVRFLYECTIGLRDPGNTGAILADAMGLGKTLTTLSLLWTLLKQGPGGRPAVGKALIVTPSSLTRNWAEEARKWLGNERLPTMVLEAGAGGAQQAAEFRHGAVARVCITSYETLRRHAGALSGCVGMVVADEGHRLKAAAGNKTMAAITGLGAARRVLLTGTPLQNNLSEFFAMCDVVNPGVLGTLPVFERVFGGPIARSRDRTASEEDKALGAQRSGELMRRVDTFVLRRGAEVNAAYLPPLSLFVVFCRPAPQQVALLRGVLGAGPARGVLAAAGPGAAAGDFGDQTLRVLTALRKICNHPALYDGTADAAGGEPAGTAAAGDFEVAHSGKLAALAAMLRRIVGADGMRCVVVSGSTAMLDLVAKFCATQGYSTARIDGSTDVSKRQDVVNAFNHHGVGQVFLLSTTAGGAGLNLTGSNRLVLVDSHWNPAMDAQALARVWRDGQRLPCVVYRLLTTGTLEEKVYQRQRAKGDIAAVTIGGGGGGGGGALGGAAAAATRGQFSREELRQLFTLRTDTACDTADVLGAAAAGGGGGGGEGEPFADCAATCGDGPLEAAIAEGHVTFVHLEKKQTNEVAVEVAAAEAAAAAAAGEPAGAGADDGAAGGSAAAGGGGGGGAWQLEVEDDL